jgi:WD40 repeat protein
MCRGDGHLYQCRWVVASAVGRPEAVLAQLCSREFAVIAPAMNVVRIFISSPGDVAEERDRARQVIESLRRRYAQHFYLKPVLWEDLPLQPDTSFQPGIDLLISREHGVDIAVFILWSRLGSPPEMVIRKADGTEYRSGTERELDLMLEARKQTAGDRPAILVYTRDDEASFDERLRGRPTKEKEHLIAQKKLVEQFISEEFHDSGSGRNVRAYHRFDRPVAFSQRLRAHLVELLDEMAGDSLAAVVWDIEKQGPPFLGLEAFQPHHADVFFGRETETLEARHALGAQARQGCAFLLLTGASGSGKSSLARAGVLPAIVENELDEQVVAWRTLIVTPSGLGLDPIAGLVRHLSAENVLPELRGDDQAINDLIEGLHREPALAVRLRVKECFSRAAMRQGGGVRLLLLLDQLEELFAPSVDDTTRREFFEVVEAFARSGHMWVLATVRSDFSAAVQAEPALVRMTAGSGLFPVLPPRSDALRRLIEEPARLAGLVFEQRNGETLADRIFRDSVENPEMLPLLEYLLRELFEHRTEDRQITYAEYEKLGGVEGAIGNRVAQLLESLPNASRKALPEIFPQLVSVDVTGQPRAFRRDAPLSELNGAEGRRQLIEALINARFLITREQNGIPVATLAHESLLRRWDKLRAWVDENRELLQFRQHVHVAAFDWLKEKARRQGPADDLLLPVGLPLSRGERALDAGLLDDDEKEFVRRSEAKAMAAQRRRRRLLQNTAIISSLVAVLLMWVATQAWRKTWQVKRLLAESDVERAERLFREDDAASAVWYLSRAVASGAASTETIERLWFSIAQRSWPRLLIEPIPHESNLLANTFDPSGDRFATATRDGIVTIYSSADGQRLGEPLVHPRTVRGVLFSPDGKQLLTACDDSNARLWKLDGNRAALAETRSHDDVVSAIAWSHDGRFFATGSWDKRLRVWSIGEKEPRFVVEMKDKVHTVAFDPVNSLRIMAVANDESAIWETPAAAPLWQHQSLGELNGACFSPDGTRLLSFSSEGDIDVSDVAGGTERPIQLALGTSCQQAAFSPDGSGLAVAYGTKVRQLSMQNPPVTTWEHSFPETVTRMIYTPDGKRLLVAGADGRIEVFDSRRGRRLHEPIVEQGTPVGLAFHPRGNRLLSARSTHAVSLWSFSILQPLPIAAFYLGSRPVALDDWGEYGCAAENGRVMVLTPPEPGAAFRMRALEIQSPITNAVFDPRGRAIVAGGIDGRILEAKLQPSSPIKEFAQLGVPISQLTFSTDGQNLAAGGDDGRIAAWQWPAANSLPVPSKHAGAVSGLSFLGTGAGLVSAGWDRRIAFTDIMSKNDSAAQWPINGEPMAMARSADSHTVAVALSNGEIWTIREPSRQPVLVCRVGSSPTSLAMSADGEIVAAGTVAGTVSVWHREGQRRICEITCSEFQINSLFLRQEGRWLVTGTEDGQARVWNSFTGHPVTERLLHASPIRHALVSKDRRQLVSVDRSGTILIWPLVSSNAPDVAAQFAAHCLTNESRDGRRFVAREQPVALQSATQLSSLIESMRHSNDEATKDEVEMLSAYLPDSQDPPAPALGR